MAPLQFHLWLHTQHFARRVVVSRHGCGFLSAVSAPSNLLHRCAKNGLGKARKITQEATFERNTCVSDLKHRKNAQDTPQSFRYTLELLMPLFGPNESTGFLFC